MSSLPVTPDPRPPARVRDPILLKRLHWEWRGECAIADDTCVSWFSLHHVSKHPRDDVRANLTMLCGDGVAGHHGLIERNDWSAVSALVAHFARDRPDVLEYLRGRQGAAQRLLEACEAVVVS